MTNFFIQQQYFIAIACLFLLGMYLYMRYKMKEYNATQQENFSVRKIRKSINSGIVRPIRKTKEGIQKQYTSVLRSIKKMIR